MPSAIPRRLAAGWLIFSKDDPSKSLIDIGNGGIIDVNQIAQKVISGEAPAGKIYTGTSVVFELNFYNNNASSAAAFGKTINDMQTYVAAGRIIYANLLEVLEIWKTVYNSAANIYATDKTASLIPSNFSATAVSSSQINLAWIDSDTATKKDTAGYKIYRCEGINCVLSNSIAIIYSSDTTSYSDTNLSSSTSYTYAVSSFDATGNESAKSGMMSVVTSASPDTAPPAAPTGLVIN